MAVTPAQNQGIQLDTSLIVQARTWATSAWEQLLSYSSLWQVLAIAGAAALAYIIARGAVRHLRNAAQAQGTAPLLVRLYNSLARIVWPAFTVVLLWVLTGIFGANDLGNHGLRVVASLLNAWIVVRLVTSNLRDGFWASALAFIIWALAALYILRLLSPVMSTLDGVTFQLAGTEFSLLRVITSAVIAISALWIGGLAGDAAQTQLRATKTLTPSMAGLFGQVAKIGLMVLAGMFALQAIGVNLTALTVFSGAIGIGIGFGLQAIFSNFISGIIILFEKSIKVGDFIELASGVTGEVREINIRSTLVTTNDHVDILVPNEEFIQAQVINWTLKEARRRVRIPFGVAYGTNKEVVRTAALEAAANVAWTYDDGAQRSPQVWLVGFGDSSLDYELVVWLNEDAVKRPAKVQADYNWEIHSALEKYDLEIPFPQRDLHIRSAPGALSVKIDSRDPSD